jgi:hypothetical protein
VRLDDFGRQGGLVTDPNAQVWDTDGKLILASRPPATALPRSCRPIRVPVRHSAGYDFSHTARRDT